LAGNAKTSAASQHWGRLAAVETQARPDVLQLSVIFSRDQIARHDIASGYVAHLSAKGVASCPVVNLSHIVLAYVQVDIQLCQSGG
jgi:hypothetical protein